MQKRTIASAFILGLMACVLGGCTTDVTFQAIDAQTLKPVPNVLVEQAVQHYSWHEFMLGFFMPDVVYPDVRIVLHSGITGPDGIVTFHDVDPNRAGFTFGDQAVVTWESPGYDKKTNAELPKVWLLNSGAGGGYYDVPVAVVNKVIIVPLPGPATRPTAACTR
jgi:hypothetical protein